MNNQSPQDIKLKEMCNILESNVQAVSIEYHNPNTTLNQQNFIETIIGASIFYLSHSNKY